MAGGDPGVDLNAVWGDSETDLVAAGSDGTILHYDGSSWSFQESTLAVDLFTIYGISGTSVLAGGGFGHLLGFGL